MAPSMPLSCKASYAPVPVPALIDDNSGVSLLGIPDSFLDSTHFAHPVNGILPATQPSNKAVDQPLHKATLDLSFISLRLSSLAKAISFKLCHLYMRMLQPQYPPPNHSSSHFVYSPLSLVQQSSSCSIMSGPILLLFVHAILLTH
jgi:hypothetical protein